MSNLSARPPHALDPLTSDEICCAAKILRAAHDLGAGMRFETIVLDEPERQRLDVHRNEGILERRAFVAAYDMSTGELFEAIVSLNREEVESWKPRPGARPRIGPDDFLLAERIAIMDPRFVSALNRRGIEDMSLVCVDPWSTGNFGYPSEKHGRLIQTFAWVRARPFDNQYAHPVEGLSAIIDINAGEVVSVDDQGPWTVPAEESNYAARFQRGWRDDIKPLEIVQPEGPSFKVEGQQIEWCGWRFRLGFTPREGLVLYAIEIKDEKGSWRSVIGRASLAEMIVPYGSPLGAHPRKNAFDCGEYGIGALAVSLALGCDCLGSIKYFDAVINTTSGESRTIKNAVCVHEEDAGLLWKHYDFRTEEMETRRSRRLVVSFIANVGNYEYAFYWYFYLDGTIALEVKLTGIINTAMISTSEAAVYGTEVLPSVIGQVHQHLFNVRLDMAVDGYENTVIEVNTIADPPGETNPHNNGFRAVETLLLTEKAARRRVESQTQRFWTIVNRSKKNRFGQPPGYRLLPGSAVTAFAPQGSQLALRGGFALNHLWVTPTLKSERWPAGDYVNQSEPGEGLPRWTDADRSVADREITVWHTFGHHHVPRPEDFPVQSTVTCGFMLQPTGFFDQNPTLNVPPFRLGASCCA